MKTKRTILHCDINHCYAQIEEMKVPALRKTAMAVGGDETTRHGIILAKNDLAKKYGIKTGESLRDAITKCPQLLIIPPHYEEYLYYTEKVKAIYRQYSDQVESFGLDEAWLDVTHSTLCFGDGEQIAKQIKQTIYEQLGLTISVGVSFNKVFAKLASDQVKPDGLVVISEENYKQSAWPLPVEEMIYIGKATKRKLNELGIYTLGELAMFNVDLLARRLGKIGVMLHEFANGRDEKLVMFSEERTAAKSIGNGVTALRDLYDPLDAQLILTVLAESVASRLRKVGMMGQVVTIGMRDCELRTRTAQRKRSSPTCLANDLLSTAMTLLEEHYSFALPLRGLSLSVSNLKSRSHIMQLSLFEEDQKEKQRRLDETIDAIRNRYGFAKIKRCSMKIDEQLTNFDPQNEHVIHPVSFL